MISPQRSLLLQDLAKIEVADLLLSRCSSDAPRWEAEADNWTRRCAAAQLDDTEQAVFARMRAEYRGMVWPVLDFAATGGGR